VFRAADRPWKKRVAMHKILSVEDDKLIRDELETLLVNAGFSVRSGQAQVFKIQPAVLRDRAGPGNDSQR